MQSSTVQWMKAAARRIKHDALALWLAARDRRTPWYAKLVAALVTAYAFSPIDLIPDFIPIIGYLDDLILVPLGILLAVSLIPRELMEELRTEAQRRAELPTSRCGMIIVVGMWIAISIGAAWLAWTYLASN